MHNGHPTIIFGRQGYHLDKLGRDTLDEATYQNIVALGLVVSHKKIVFINTLASQ